MARLMRAILVARAISGHRPWSSWRWPPSSRGTGRSAPSTRSTFVVRPAGCRPLRPRLPRARDRADPPAGQASGTPPPSATCCGLGAARRHDAGVSSAIPGPGPRSGGCRRSARRTSRALFAAGAGERQSVRRDHTSPTPQGPDADGRLGEPSARRGRGSGSLRPFVPLTRAGVRSVRPVESPRRQPGWTSSRRPTLLSPQINQLTGPSARPWREPTQPGPERTRRWPARSLSAARSGAPCRSPRPGGRVTPTHPRVRRTWSSCSSTTPASPTSAVTAPISRPRRSTGSPRAASATRTST